MKIKYFFPLLVILASQTFAQEFEISNLEFNTAKMDFAPAFYKEGLVFAKSSSTSIKNDTIAQVDLFYVKKIDNGFSSPKKFSNEINSKFHEGPSVFMGDSMILFTRTGLAGKKRITGTDERAHLYLMQAENRKGKWENVKSLPFSNSEYSTGHPALSPDGKLMVFASDKSNGIGGVDLYVTKYINNEWGTPENMGINVNTLQNEMFPFIDSKGVLYFSSNREESFGGLDVFKVELDEAGKIKGKPERLPKPLNSDGDDFSLITNNDGTSGYLTSNRGGGKGKDDIYSFNLTGQTLVEEVTVDKERSISIQVVDDQTNKGVLSNISLLDSEGRSVLRGETDVNGKIHFDTFESDLSIINVVTSSYFATKKEMKRDESEIIIKVNKSVGFSGVIKDNVTGKGIEGVKVSALDTASNTNQATVTDVNGDYFLKLAPNKYYKLKLSKSGFFNISDEIITKNRPIASNEISFDLEPIIIGKSIAIENIYYELASSKITEESAKSLDKIVILMKENPEIQVELGAHTDARGKNTYNLSLSQKRAESVVLYVVNHGISKSRMVAKGYGETKLLNKCDDGNKCEEKEHAINRRTEFKVIAIDN